MTQRFAPYTSKRIWPARGSSEGVASHGRVLGRWKTPFDSPRLSSPLVPVVHGAVMSLSGGLPANPGRHEPSHACGNYHQPCAFPMQHESRKLVTAAPIFMSFGFITPSVLAGVVAYVVVAFAAAKIRGRMIQPRAGPGAGRLPHCLASSVGLPWFWPVLGSPSL